VHGKAFAAALVWAFCWQSATAILQRQAEPQYSAAVGGEHSLPIPSRRRCYCVCSFVRAELLTTGRMWLSHVGTPAVRRHAPSPAGRPPACLLLLLGQPAGAQRSQQQAASQPPRHAAQAVCLQLVAMPAASSRSTAAVLVPYAVQYGTGTYRYRRYRYRYGTSTVLLA
jgi:hypothetical protein